VRMVWHLAIACVIDVCSCQPVWTPLNAGHVNLANSDIAEQIARLKVLPGRPTVVVRCLVHGEPDLR
jgi:hypothetical protein